MEPPREITAAFQAAMVAMVALQQEAQQRGRQDATVAAQRDTTLRIEHVEAEFARERQQLRAEAERLRSELRQQASAAQQHAANASQAFAEAEAARNALVTQAASYQQEAQRSAARGRQEAEAEFARERQELADEAERLRSQLRQQASVAHISTLYLLPLPFTPSSDSIRSCVLTRTAHSASARFFVCHGPIMSCHVSVWDRVWGPCTPPTPYGFLLTGGLGQLVACLGRWVIVADVSLVSFSVYKNKEN